MRGHLERTGGDPELVPEIGPGPKHRTLFLNRAGGTYTKGTDDDSSTNTATVPRATATVPVWPYTDDEWTTLVACVREKYARFDVSVTEVDPNDLEHIEVVIGGQPEDVGLPVGIAGAAPFASDCSVIERAVVFVFPLTNDGDQIAICETAAHESGHAFGLDHEYWCPDLMTYLPGCQPKVFDDTPVTCGEDSERACACGATQNSARVLFSVLGGAPGDTTPPQVVFSSLYEGAQVAAGASVAVAPSDDVGVAQVTLFADSEIADVLGSPPWEPALLPTMTPGIHSLTVQADDFSGNTGSTGVNVVVPACASSADCTGGEMCNSLGACTYVSLGIGEPCEVGDNCASGLCGDDGERRLCTLVCELSATGLDTGCPPGSVCHPATGGVGVCWPDPSGPGFSGACAVSPGNHPVRAAWGPRKLIPLIAVALAAALLVARRARW